MKFLRNWAKVARAFCAYIDGPAFPSGMDIRLAFHPEAVYLIISLQDRRRPEVRAYRIERQNVTELRISTTAR